MILEEKTYKMKELAEWFGVTPGAFSNRKVERLKELSEYCEFEDLGRKGIKVTRVIIPERKHSARKVVDEHFMEAWGENPSDCRGAACYLENHYSEELQKANSNTVYSYVCFFKRKRFGVYRKYPGVDGYCNMTSAVRLDNLEHRFRYYTEEEQAIRNEMLKVFFMDEGQRIEEAAKLKHLHDIKELTDKEYIEAFEELNCMAPNGDWDKFNTQFEKRINQNTDWATELIETAYPDEKIKDNPFAED